MTRAAALSALAVAAVAAGVAAQGGIAIALSSPQSSAPPVAAGACVELRYTVTGYNATAPSSTLWLYPYVNGGAWGGDAPIVAPLGGGGGNATWSVVLLSLIHI